MVTTSFIEDWDDIIGDSCLNLACCNSCIRYGLIF